MKNWTDKLILEDDEFITNYTSATFNTEIPIRFMGTNDKIHAKQTQIVTELIASESEWIEKAIHAILEYYTDVYPHYRSGMEAAGADEAFIEKYLPKEINREKLLTLITPDEIYIHPEEECEIGNFGFGFECEWDIEHGLGVQFNHWNVVETGGIDVAFGY